MSQVVKPSLVDDSVDRRIEAARAKDGPTIISDLPMEKYHSVDALSGSLFLPALSSPAHYRAARDRGDSPPTPTQLYGTQIHGAILEGWLEQSLVIEGPEGNWSHKQNRDYKKALEEQYPDADIVKPQQYQGIVALRDNFFAHPVIAKLIEKRGAFAPEASIFYTMEREGVAVFAKARPDAVWVSAKEGEPTIHMNLKSVVSNEGDTFSNQFLRYGYDMSAAHYDEAMLDFHQRGDRTPVVHLFVALERKPPYSVRVYKVSPEMLAHGYERRDHAFSIILNAELNDDYSAYPEVEDLYLPPWADEVTDESDIEEGE